MALYRLRLIWRMDSGVPDDRAVWSWGIDAAAPPDPVDLTAGFTAAWVLGSTSTAQMRNIITNRLYSIAWELLPAAGGATVMYAPDDTLRGLAGSLMAPQVTLSITPQITTARGPANRSRHMYGPIGAAASTGRPTTNTMTAALNFATEWHRQLVALGCTPVVLHAGGTSSSPIVSYSVANSYGSLRTRRFEVTQRTTATP